MYKTLLIGLLLVGCAPATSLRSIDPQFEQYVRTFEQLLGHPINFSVQFDLIDPSHAGYCNYNAQTGLPYVTISSYAWPQMTNAGREQLIFHELGHCQLGRIHNDNVDSYGQPVSIMYYMSWGDRPSYSQNRDALIRELFGR